MKEFDLVYRNIRLRIICDEYMESLIKIHFMNHINFEESTNKPSYTLIISDKLLKVSGEHYKMVDKWFDNATLDCYIDNKDKICYATNFYASSEKYKNLLIEYFVANVFNRFLEIEGHLGIHSSCVEKNNSGVLFVAGRYSGKTMCMLNLMNEGFNSVTNDKIALKEYDGDIIGYGIAQSVSIRLGPQFCKQSENYKYVKLAKERGIEIKEKDMLEGNNLILSDNELAEINNVRQVFDSKISCIIRPSYNPYLKKPVFNSMTEEQIIELFYSNYMSLVHETTEFLRNINCESTIDRTTIINELIKIPSFSCQQNENTTKEFVEEVKKLILR